MMTSLKPRYQKPVTRRSLAEKMSCHRPKGLTLFFFIASCPDKKKNCRVEDVQEWRETVRFISNR